MSGEAPLVWRAWWPGYLARAAPARLLLGALLLLGATLALLALLPPLAGGILLAVLVVSLDQALLPITYRVEASGVTVRTALRTRRYAWSEFTSAERTPAGLGLASPVRRRLSLLAPGRGEEILARTPFPIAAAPDRIAVS